MSDDGPAEPPSVVETAADYGSGDVGPGGDCSGPSLAEFKSRKSSSCCTQDCSSGSPSTVGPLG